MEISRQKNIVINGADSKPITLDIFYSGHEPKPVVIYAHGFVGFKDWGHFDLIADTFVQAGFTFIKFNFSHNGTTPQQPQDFTDLEAFAHGTYTKELYDLQCVIDWTTAANNNYTGVINAAKLFLIGHSKGGGIVLLKAAEENKVKSVATWASVAQCKTPWGSWDMEKIEQWKKDGVAYYTNGRTKQQMPMYYSLYKDYEAHSDRLDILKAVERLNVPLLICHGTKDEAVPMESAYALHNANSNSELFIVESDHVFGRKHPWIEAHLPQATVDVVTKTIAFFSVI